MEWESIKEINWNGVVTPDNPVINSFKPGANLIRLGEKYIAMYGIHNSARIVAQRDVFTFFGKSLKAMERIYIDENFPQDCLMKLILPKAKIHSLLKSLESIGITDSVVYPDLEGFSKK